MSHEIGPEYLNIDPTKNLQAGFFYLSKEDEKTEYEKKSPRKRTVVLDLPGVLVSFADPKSGGISSAQCVELVCADGPKQFVYFWERPKLHWFLAKLRGTFEIILWSSLSHVLTSRIVEHIERKSSYFAYVLSKEQAMDFTNRKPTNLVLAQATLSIGKKGDQKK